jgi:hypothetical protein
MAVPNQTIYVNNINEKVKKDGAMPEMFSSTAAPLAPHPNPNCRHSHISSSLEKAGPPAPAVSQR